MGNELSTLANDLAEDLGFTSANNLVDVLKKTAFSGTKKPISNEQMMALLIVAKQYNLNPWTREIYAFPDKNNGIVPMVGLDGWCRIINSHPQFDGVEFSFTNDSCTCSIHRKDRNHPTVVTEYMSECKRESDFSPWKTHPKRMLRHKALIQCARLSFGYVGFYDPDEGERILESVEAEPAQQERVIEAEVLPEYPSDRFDKNLPSWVAQIEQGNRTPEDIINIVSTSYTLTEKQTAIIRDIDFP